MSDVRLQLVPFKVFCEDIFTLFADAVFSRWNESCEKRHKWAWEFKLQRFSQKTIFTLLLHGTVGTEKGWDAFHANFFLRFLFSHLNCLMLCQAILRNEVLWDFSKSDHQYHDHSRHLLLHENLPYLLTTRQVRLDGVYALASVQLFSHKHAKNISTKRTELIFLHWRKKRKK